MTLGERILKYRKKAGISQEELADRLNVTRQSISLWETDQTVPSLDNLITLAEMFNVSMDELCGLNTKEQTAESETAVDTKATEEQKCLASAHSTLTPTLLKKLQKLSQRKYIIAYVASLVYCLIAIISFLFGSKTNYDFSILFSVIFIVFSALLIRTLVVGEIQYKKNLQRYKNFEYKYLFYNDYIIVKTKADMAESVFYIQYDEIKKCKQDKEHIFIYYEKSILPVETASISIYTNVIMGLLLNKGAQQNKLNATVNNKEPIRTLLTVMFILSILSVFAAMTAVQITTNYGFSMIECMWEFFLFIPIPLTSAILGIIFIQKNYKCKKNIIAGFIMCAILAIYGCFTFIF